MAFKPRPMALAKKMKPMPGARPANNIRPPIMPPKVPSKSAAVNHNGDNDEYSARGNFAPTTTSAELEMTVLGILNKFPMGYSPEYVPIISLEDKKYVERKPRKYGPGFDYHITAAGKAAWDKYQK